MRPLTAATSATYGRGLESLIAGDTALSTIDGRRGELRYRGYSIEALAERGSFDDVTHLLIHGDLPDPAAAREWSHALARWRSLPESVLQVASQMTSADAFFPTFRTALAMLPRDGGGTDDAARLLTQTSETAALLLRCRGGHAPVRPRDDLSLSDHVLWSMTGTVPSETASRAFEASLIVQAEHGIHAAALAAVTVRSAGGCLLDSVIAGVGALGGPLHGGANGPAYRMVLETESVDEARAAAEAGLAARTRFPGYGHRVYKCPDPRARLLEPHARALLADAGTPEVWDRFEAMRATIEAALGPRGLYANIDAVTGFIYGPLGMPEDAFTVPFCLAIQAGWIAHALEYGDGPAIWPDTHDPDRTS